MRKREIAVGIFILTILLLGYFIWIDPQFWGVFIATVFGFTTSGFLWELGAPFKGISLRKSKNQ